MQIFFYSPFITNKLSVQCCNDVLGGMTEVALQGGFSISEKPMYFLRSDES